MLRWDWRLQEFQEGFNQAELGINALGPELFFQTFSFAGT
jgi:hypothetical protein